MEAGWRKDSATNGPLCPPAGIGKQPDMLAINRSDARRFQQHAPAESLTLVEFQVHRLGEISGNNNASRAESVKRKYLCAISRNAGKCIEGLRDGERDKLDARLPFLALAE